MRVSSLLAIVFLMAEVSPSVAQWPHGRVFITFVEGEVQLDGRPAPLDETELSEKSVLQTTKGRVEIRFGRGDTLFLGGSSAMRVRRNIAMGEQEPVILSGSAVVTTGGVGPSLSCVKGVQLSDAGTFRFDVRQVLGENFCQLKVYKGAAAVQMPSFIWVLTPGRSISLNLSCGDHTPRSEFSVTETDALDRWSQTRATPESGENKPQQR
jgi:hypothetical protein